jgi:hypothetical protein
VRFRVWMKGELVRERTEDIMLTPEERALLTDTQDRLISLFVQHDEAVRAEEWDKALDLEAQIDDAQCEADAIRIAAGGGNPAG